MTRLIRFAFTVVLIFAVAAVALAATDSANAKADFLASNPNREWTFGFLDRDGKFIAYNTTFKVDDDTVGWCLDSMPGIFGDITMSFHDTLVEKFGIRWEPGQLCVNPGLDCQAVVVRWTAPTAGAIRVGGRLKSLTKGGRKTSISVLKNGTELTRNEIAGDGSEERSSDLIERQRSAAAPLPTTDAPSSADLSTDVTVSKGTTIDLIFAKESDLGGSHVGVDLTIEASGSGGKVSYNLNPKLPTIQQVADAIVVEVSK
ncbi:MAG: hypothetical protein ACYC0V_08170 [Armatimonadota bacterium]